jgi:hypothetical protein
MTWWTDIYDPLLRWLTIISLAGAASGSLVSKFVPGGVIRAQLYVWRPYLATVGGFAVSLILTKVMTSVLAIRFSFTSIVVFAVAGLVAYWFSRRPKRDDVSFLANWLMGMISPRQVKSNDNAPIGPAEQMVFKAGWKTRPKFETATEGSFVGRADLLNRLSSQFISKGGGTILISGVRGVGKTALVDRALVDARQKLANVYWSEAAKFLETRATPFHPIDMLARRTLVKLGESLPTETNISQSDKEVSKLRRAAAEYSKLPLVRFWSRLNPVGRRIRDMHCASRWQLFVLKFSASDISGAMAEPEQKQTGKPRIDPDKLLRSLIRKLYMTLHSSRPDEEAVVLQKSLCTKKKRQLFIQTLEKAFDKSVSKSYKEVVSNSVSDYIKDNRTTVSERKFDIVRIVLALTVIGGAYQGAWGLVKILRNNWTWFNFVAPDYVASVSGLAAAGIGAYLTWTVYSKRTRERGSDQSQQSQFSLEYDFSIERMQKDLESLMRALQPDENAKFSPYRCFMRSVVIFDELDKLENPDKQLDDVITHFKNFFTLSDSVFVFLTDHEFYEYLNREAIRAQRARHYSPQHTFFTEKIYLRKPEFGRFREAFYNFTDEKWIQKRAASPPSDPALMDYLLLNGNALSVIPELPLPALTYLYIRKDGYADDAIRAAIDEAFKTLEGRKDPLALAQIWASQARSRAGVGEMRKTKKEFEEAGGKSNPQAVSLLYFCRYDFEHDRNTIAKWYADLQNPPLKEYESIKRVQFPLGDLAQALCFQARNHYFDLYQLVYDYITEYSSGSPVIRLEDNRFAPDTRLASRYQRLLEIAFEAVKENHPSREYFNGLLMETLYSVFDKRGSIGGVKIAEILFQDNDKSGKAGWLTPKTNGDNVTPYNGRDVEKINEAVVSLLQLLLEHKAISQHKESSQQKESSSSSANLENLLSANVIDWHALMEVRFEWNDDVQSLIKLTSSKEAYEDELIKFWRDNKFELQALDNELAKLWRDATIPDDAAKLRNAIRELRAKTDAVRLRTVKVSETDAELLKASVMTLEARRALMSKTILDRIKAEEDAFILEEAIKGSADEQAREMDARRKEFETATGFPLRALVCPSDTDCFIFFASSPIPTDADLNWSGFPRATDYILWYTTTRQELNDSDNVLFYYPPPGEASARVLFDDYRDLATEGRLGRIVAHLEASGFNDTTLAIRAGAEAIDIVGPGSQLQVALGRPEIEMAAALLDRAVSHFQADATAATRAPYNIKTGGKAKEAASALVSYVTTSIDVREEVPFDLKAAVEEAVQLGNSDLSNLSAEDWLKLFESGRSGSFFGVLLAAVVKQAVAVPIQTKFSRLKPLLEQRHLELISNQLGTWIVSQISQIAQATSADVKQMLLTSEWSAELEKRRRAFRSKHLPPQATPSKFSLMKRARRRSTKTATRR